MKDLDFSPIFKEIVPNVRNSKFTVMYFGRHFNKNILLLKHEPLTLMLVFEDSENEILIPEFVKVVSSRDDQVKEGVKIVGKDNLILLLDENGNLWKLVNAFETLDPDKEHLHSLDKQKYYEWSPFRIFQFEKALQITGSQQGFICLGVEKNSKKKLRWLNLLHYPTFEDFEISDEAYQQTIFLKTIQINIKDSLFKNELDTGKEALIISNKITGETFICSIHKKYLLNVSSVPLLNVIDFEDFKSLLLAFENGKLLFISYNHLKKHLINFVAYLSKKLIFIEKCNICNACLIWSDGCNLHHTNLSFDFRKPCFVRLIHLKLNFYIHGIFSLLSINQGFIAVTFNNMYYQIYKNESAAPVEIKKSSEELLQEIYEGGLKIKKLNQDLKKNVDYLKSRELIQATNVSELVELSWEKNCIMLKSKIKKVFSRYHWKFSLRGRLDNKELIEMKDLDVDLAEGMLVKIFTDLKGEVFVDLVGNYGSDYDLLFARLGKIGECKEDVRIQKISKILQQIAEKRNPYLKI